MTSNGTALNEVGWQLNPSTTLGDEGVAQTHAPTKGFALNSETASSQPTSGLRRSLKLWRLEQRGRGPCRLDDPDRDGGDALYRGQLRSDGAGVPQRGLGLYVRRA